MADGYSRGMKARELMEELRDRIKLAIEHNSSGVDILVEMDDARNVLDALEFRLKQKSFAGMEPIIGGLLLRMDQLSSGRRLEPSDVATALREILRYPRSIGLAPVAEEVEPAPIPMILYCPHCGGPHVDKATPEWDNPPHRSHLCAYCGFIWRPADVPTMGVEKIETRGKADTATMTRVGPHEPWRTRQRPAGWSAEALDSQFNNKVNFGGEAVLYEPPEYKDRVAEKRSRFVKLGDHRIDPDKVVWFNPQPNGTLIEMDTATQIMVLLPIDDVARILNRDQPEKE